MKNGKNIEIIGKRKRVFTKFPTESMTSQEFKDECDVNRIMARYMKDGFWPAKERQGQYGDFTMFEDLAAAVEVVQGASEAFSELPAQVRKRFKNNPQELVDFVRNPENIDEAVKLGIVDKRFVPKKEVPDSPAPSPSKDGKKEEKK